MRDLRYETITIFNELEVDKGLESFAQLRRLVAHPYNHAFLAARFHPLAECRLDRFQKPSGIRSVVPTIMTASIQ
jgi:hypothetical protein